MAVGEPVDGPVDGAPVSDRVNDDPVGDIDYVTRCLGRRPKGDWSVALRDEAGRPVVIRNAPFLADGTPMPTLYWLVDPDIRRRVGVLESHSGVRRAEQASDPGAIAAAHERYAHERDRQIPTGAEPKPFGGVGGTRRGVKCLHAHYAYFLVGGDDPVGRWVDDHLDEPAPPSDDRSAAGVAHPGGRPMSATFAAIDCGTNSTRLLIGDGTTTSERLMTITRLGEGVADTGSLTAAAIDRVVDCLVDYRSVMDRYELAGVRMTATSAARDAANSDEFFDRAEAAVGVRPELLSGEEEGQLSFLGATAELDPADGPFLVVDIGGGSTEFSFGTDHCEAAISLDVGCVRMTEQFLESDPPLPEELSACLSVLQLHWDDVRREVPQVGEAVRFVGLAGTVSAAAMVELGLTTYDRDQVHHFELTKAAAEDVFRTLATESLADRLHNPGLEPQRADVIVGGMCVLVSILRNFGFDSCLVSEADILDGLVMSQLDRP